MLQLLLAAVAFSELVPRPPGPADAFDLFREGDLGYSHFRIPILATVDGPVPALLLFVEARKFSFMDWGTRGLLMRASYDGGAGWTPATQVVTDPESSNKTMEIAGHGLDGIGQPSSVIVDRVRHKVILMFSPWPISTPACVTSAVPSVYTSTWEPAWLRYFSGKFTP